MAVTTPDGYAGWNTSTAKKKQPTYDPYVTKDRVPTYSAPVAGYGNTNAGAGTNEYTTTAQRQQQSANVSKPVVNNNGGGGDAPVVTTGGSASVVYNPYESYMNKIIELEKQRLAEEKARQEQIRQERIAAANKVKEARIKATNETYNNSMGNLNAATESSLRQAYIKHRMDEKNLPQQMQAFGMSGGATETNLANMKNAYGNNRTSIMNENLAQQRLIEQDRANAIAGAEADAANAHLDAVGDAANYEASAVRDYNNGLIKMYESALDKMPTYNNVGATTGNIRNNQWYKQATNLLEEGSGRDEIIAYLDQNGVSEEIIDAILNDWDSSF